MCTTWGISSLFWRGGTFTPFVLFLGGGAFIPFVLFLGGGHLPHLCSFWVGGGIHPICALFEWGAFIPFVLFFWLGGGIHPICALFEWGAFIPFVLFLSGGHLSHLCSFFGWGGGHLPHLCNPRYLVHDFKKGVALALAFTLKLTLYFHTHCSLDENATVLDVVRSCGLRSSIYFNFS